MTFEAWLVKVKTKLSRGLNCVRHHHRYTAVPNQKVTSPAKNGGDIGFLAFEMAGMMSKLLQIWSSLSDCNVIRLHSSSICVEGVRRIVSTDEAFLLRLARAEIADNLRLVADSVSFISHRCEDQSLRSFDRIFRDFADSGRDPRRWILSSKEMEAANKKMDRLAEATATLYRETDELLVMEDSLRKAFSQKHGGDAAMKEQKIVNLQYKISCQKRKVRHLKDRSIWNRSYDEVNSMLVRSIFTALARIKLVFGLGSFSFPASLPRSFSVAVHPLNQNSNASNIFFSGPLTAKYQETNSSVHFFESNSNLLKPPETALGAAGLAVHYANLILLTEKMIKSPQLVGPDARDDLYSMLPSSLRSVLQERLEGVKFTANDPSIASACRRAMGKVLAWLSPMAHDTIRWESERSFENQSSAPRTSVMMLQTLVFADREKTEAAITELLVGLNYIWRFEREMRTKDVLLDLDQCSDSINGGGSLDKSSSGSRRHSSSLSAMVS